MAPRQGALPPLSQLSVPLAGLDHRGAPLPGAGLKLVGVPGKYSPMEVVQCWSLDAGMVDAGGLCAGTSHAGGALAGTLHAGGALAGTPHAERAHVETVHAGEALAGTSYAGRARVGTVHAGRPQAGTAGVAHAGIAGSRAVVSHEAACQVGWHFLDRRSDADLLDHQSEPDHASSRVAPA